MKMIDTLNLRAVVVLAWIKEIENYTALVPRKAWECDVVEEVGSELVDAIDKYCTVARRMARNQEQAS